MRLGLIATTFVAILTGAEAACKKDACYNNVAVAKAGGPKLASRLADCSSILKTVVDDDVTRTTTIYSTASTSIRVGVTTTTTTTATQTIFFAPNNRRRGIEELSGILEARDKIVIKGNKPTYATSCKDNQDYAIACLCYGVKAGSQKVVTKVQILSLTTTETSTSTTLKTSTSVSVTSKAQPTECTAAQKSYCRTISQCQNCAISFDPNKAVCIGAYQCGDNCKSNADCQQFGEFTGYCVYDNETDYCGGGSGSGFCASDYGVCPQAQPFQRVRRGFHQDTTN